MNERDHFSDIAVDRKILQLILKKKEMGGYGIH
jgi:hypothetical protein